MRDARYGRAARHQELDGPGHEASGTAAGEMRIGYICVRLISSVCAPASIAWKFRNSVSNSACRSSLAKPLMLKNAAFSPKTMMWSGKTHASLSARKTGCPFPAADHTQLLEAYSHTSSAGLSALPEGGGQMRMVRVGGCPEPISEKKRRGPVDTMPRRVHCRSCGVCGPRVGHRIVASQPVAFVTCSQSDGIGNESWRNMIGTAVPLALAGWSSVTVVPDAVSRRVACISPGVCAPAPLVPPLTTMKPGNSPLTTGAGTPVIVVLPLVSVPIVFTGDGTTTWNSRVRKLQLRER